MMYGLLCTETLYSVKQLSTFENKLIMILKRNIRSFYYLNILLWKAADLNKRQTNSHGIEKKSSFIVAQPYFCTMDWPTVY